MTCIVSIEHEDSVWIGADSLAVDESGDYHLCATPKVFTRGELILGCSGSFLQQNVLEHDFLIPTLPGASAPQPALDAWMCTEFVGAARAALRHGGALTLKEGKEECCNFIVGLRGFSYQVESDFGVIRSTRGFDAIGCGAKYALGALHAMGNISLALFVDVKIARALAAAESLNTGVRGPFTILQGGISG